MHRLQAPRAIHMRDGRDDVAFVFAHIDDIEHEAAGIVSDGLGQHEIVFRPFGQHRWREGTERLAEFDLDVDDDPSCRPAGDRPGYCDGPGRGVPIQTAPGTSR